jgi:hypothetical protein
MKSEAEKRFASARIAAFRAPELTSVVGKNQVLDALDRRWKEAKGQLGLGECGDPTPPGSSAVISRAVFAHGNRVALRLKVTPLFSQGFLGRCHIRHIEAKYGVLIRREIGPP